MATDLSKDFKHFSVEKSKKAAEKRTEQTEREVKILFSDLVFGLDHCPENEVETRISDAVTKALEAGARVHWDGEQCARYFNRQVSKPATQERINKVVERLRAAA